MEDKIKKLLNDVRPSLQAHGGDVEFVELTDKNIVKVKLKGACSGCAMAQMTMKQGIERYIKDKLPDIKAVEAV